MLILGIESSGLTASAALVEDDLIRAEFTIHNKLTHSETLLPMVREMMKISGTELSAVDAIAVSAGPGSFTGLRIGAAAAKGLALAINIPIVAVSTLRAMSRSAASHTDEVILCPIMDARRGQVYGAAYQKGICIVPEGARAIGEYLEELKAAINASEDAENGGKKPVCVFLGDGVPVHEKLLQETLAEQFRKASAEYSRQRAGNVAAEGMELYRAFVEQSGHTAAELRELGADGIDCFAYPVMNSDDFVPDYMRKPQAEREMQAGLLEDPGMHSLKKIARGDK